MAVFFVTYELGASTREPALLAAIKQMPWTQLTEHAFAVATSESDEDLFDRLHEFVDDGDSLYLAVMKMPYRGIGHREVNYWLEKHLRW
ncbi:hypothetical protein MWN34_11435 [Ancylobacter sp. 6x-1]|uniref:Uncharacterized protein n=1 Tax=Ancylobacter crimeensis TaxID=2579147 RepID=A0ABT0DC41_9HYPH|nr:hypothetical protein [Ancylobacter crimeensis]MCK0197527.1 hypothetical protein [Ancylobacter crimeensis]